MSKGLDADQIAFYKENGFLMIERLFDPSDIDRLTDELDGVTGGEALIVSRVATPVEGMQLRVADAPEDERRAEAPHEDDEATR